MSTISEVLLTRYRLLLSANAEEDPGRSNRDRHYWLGRRHELKYLLEELDICVPPLVLGVESDEQTT